MIIEVVDQLCVITVKSKDQSPVAIDGNGEKSFQVTAQFMESPVGRIQVAGLSRVVQSRQQDSPLRRMMGLNARFAASQEECLDAFVAKTPDHREF